MVSDDDYQTINFKEKMRYQSPTPCSAYVSTNGTEYAFSAAPNATDICIVCFHDKEYHEFYNECGNCSKEIGKGYKLVVASAINGFLDFEKEEFCGHACLREFLEVWGY